MGVAVKAATVLAALLVVLGTVGLVLALYVAPTLLVGGLVSVLFGIGFWVASGYVLLARLAVRLLLGR